MLGSRGGQTGGGFDERATREQYESAKWLSPHGRQEIVSWLQTQSTGDEATPSPTRSSWRDGIIMGGMMGGGMGGAGTLQALLTEMDRRAEGAGPGTPVPSKLPRGRRPQKK